MTRALATVAGVLLLSLASVQCHGQQICGPRADILKALESQYGEKPVALGIGPSRVLEIVTSPNGETWTAIVTGTDGQSCVVMNGQQWTLNPKGRGI